MIDHRLEFCTLLQSLRSQSFGTRAERHLIALDLHDLYQFALAQPKSLRVADPGDAA